MRSLEHGRGTPRALSSALGARAGDAAWRSGRVAGARAGPAVQSADGRVVDMSQNENEHNQGGAAGHSLAPLLLRLRRAPVRARGRVTFERILDTTASLLDEVGVERITTNLIASRAGINIATLYKYFPNKLSVINALFEHQMRQRAADSLSVLPSAGTVADWRAVVDAVFDQVRSARSRQPGSIALRRAMQSSPELRRIHDATSREVAELLARWLMQNQQVAEDDARLTARCAIEVLTALMDLGEGEDEADRKSVV